MNSVGKYFEVTIMSINNANFKLIYFLSISR